MSGYEEMGAPGHEDAGERRFVSQAELRARGWTEGMVRRLLRAPDRLAARPPFRGAPHARLYRVERVVAIERSEEFRAAAKASARRSEAVRAAVRRRREQALERIRAEPIDVPLLEPGTLALRAVEHRARREREWRRSGADTAGAQGVPPPRPSGVAPLPADRSAVDPWKVDYLRHRLSHYYQLLDEFPGRADASGRAEAAALLHRRICAAIAEAYPQLAQECERQAHVQWPGPPP